VKRTLLLILGWSAALFTLYVLYAGLQGLWNYFDWHPTWDTQVAFILVGMPVILVGIWFLARATKDKVSRIVSGIFCALTTLPGIGMFPAEPTSQPRPPIPWIPATSGNWVVDGVIVCVNAMRMLGTFEFTRSRPSPFWFRGGGLLLMCLPSIIWLWWAWRHSHQRRSVANAG
jgi:hypothetical protein